MTLLLEAKNICKTFFTPSPLEVLQNISLTVHRGESIAIVGKSGSGKSALLHILGTLDAPTKGSVFFPHAASFALEKLRMYKIGFIFQSFYLLEECSVWDNILMPGRIAKKEASFLRRRGEELLSLVELEGEKQMQVKLLSGGQKQKVAVARALFNDPDILFADEPTGSLDEINALRIRSLLFQAVENQGKALLLVTHDLELASTCSKKYLLKDKSLFIDNNTNNNP
ncbi:MAG: ATP-binding cassette domain-containing protein [Chlamydiae bacterium]|nr:ATP-binding cassette domain-containing protein [Chlamydiota bacterium]